MAFFKNFLSRYSRASVLSIFGNLWGLEYDLICSVGHGSTFREVDLI